MAGTHRITHISFPDMAETSYHDITSGIAEGSLLVDELLQKEGLNFGEFNSNRFEVQLYNIADVTGQKIVVWQVDTDTSTEIPIFTGYVDSCKQNRSGYYREIIAYDVFYKLMDKNISEWWTDFWDTYTDKASIRTIRTSLLTHVGIEAADPSATYTNDSVEITRRPYDATLTFGVLMQSIGTWQGIIPNADREGKIEFIVLGNTYTDVADNINTRDSLFEEFSTQAIDVVWVYDDSYKIIGYGGSGSQNPYRIQGNVLTAGIEDVNIAASALYTAIHGITYTPGDIKYIVSDLDLKLGTRIHFGNGYTYIFENVLSGPILIEQESKSGGEQYLQESSNYNSDISSINNRLSNESIQYYLFYNSTAITINDGEDKKIIDIRFTSNEKTIVVFQAEVLLEAETTVDGTEYNDAEVTIKYVYNDNILTDYKPKERYTDGDHILHLLYYLTIQAARLDHLEVWLEANGGSIYIDAGHIRSSVYGQNLAASDSWDGTFDIRETIPTVTLAGHAPSVTGKSLTDSASIQLYTPIDLTFETEITTEDNLSHQPNITNKGLTEELLVEQNDES